MLPNAVELTQVFAIVVDLLEAAFGPPEIQPADEHTPPTRGIVVDFPATGHRVRFFESRTPIVSLLALWYRAPESSMSPLVGHQVSCTRTAENFVRDCQNAAREAS